MKNLITYTIGEYAESADGKTFTAIKNMKCENDSQAEHEARRICEDTDATGYYIRRAGDEWFARA